MKFQQLWAATMSGLTVLPLLRHPLCWAPTMVPAVGLSRVGTLLGRLLVTFLTTLAALPLVPAQVAAQPVDSQWTAPRTPDGHPDLQGIWSFATITPLERPSLYAGRDTLTAEEVAQANQDAAVRASSERRKELTRDQDVALAYNQFWWDRGTSTGRTSLVVDPPNGRIPAKTIVAQSRIDATRAARARDAWGPEDRGGAERCLQYRPLPRLPTGYNNHHQIFQIPGYVIILTEMIHHVRVIPLDDRPHVDATIRLLNGDSRGHWEGNTLVVETTNFSDALTFYGSGANRRLVERFTRIDENTIDWRFTVEDNTAWAHPWSAVLPFKKVEGPIYEYACHERNYGMENLLVSARALERPAAGTTEPR